jgi:glutathione peroxidase
MKMKTLWMILAAIALTVSLSEARQPQKEKKDSMDTGLYGFTMKTIDGKDKPLGEYKGNVLLIVNTASFCGYTPQYKDLEALYGKYKSRGLKILAFPANNFGSQEPGTNEEIKDFCEMNYKVTFDMFSKISVKGNDQHPLYQYLTKETDFTGDVAWNFTKYLVDAQGKVVGKYPSKVSPMSKEIAEKIEALLSSK